MVARRQVVAAATCRLPPEQDERTDLGIEGMGYDGAWVRRQAERRPAAAEATTAAAAMLI